MTAIRDSSATAKQKAKCILATDGKSPEALLHNFFGSARLDLELKDRFGVPVKPKEWFFVPLNVIEEALEKIQEETIDQFRYDPKAASLVQL